MYWEILLSALLMFLAWNLLRHPGVAKSSVRHQTISTILHFFHLFDTMKAGQALQARATANARLVRAFNLTNTFVSPEPDIHSAFVSRAKRLIHQSTRRKWDHFQATATAAVHLALSDASQGQDFDTFVQDVTLRTVLCGLLSPDQEPRHLDSNDIRIVGSLITRLWQLSKHHDPRAIPSDLLPRLNEHLRHLIPDQDQYPNPLDFVIPAWETLWRVIAAAVAYSVLQDHVSVFSNLYHNPTVEQFSAFSDTSPSSEAIIFESLRLHPPSKRIGRAVFETRIHPIFQSLHRLAGIGCQHIFGTPSFLYSRVESADIESVMHCKDIWGTTALQFDPSRFDPSRLDEVQKKIKLLPFGFGKYRCVATSWAPMACGIIAGAILDQIGTPGQGCAYTLVGGESVGGRTGWDGWRVVKV